MNLVKRGAVLLLFLIFAVALGAQFVAPAEYAMQFRDAPNAPPSHRFLLGTDELGRDRLSRVIYGSRVSLLLAPAAAALATMIAALAGTAAGFWGGWRERAMMVVADFFLSFPWLFLLITARAMLPLDVAPAISVVLTFVLLGLLGWAAAARVVCAGTRSLRHSGFMLNAYACGCRPWRMVSRQLLPNMAPALWAQFVISIPVFILAEANLSMLGLGVAEPLPSLGGLMREMENVSGLAGQPWRLAPLVLLAITVGGFQILMAGKEIEA